MGNKKEMKATTNVAAKTKTTFATTINNKVARDDTQLECCQKIIRKFSPAYACDTVRCFGCEQRVCCECCTCRQFSIFLPLSPSAVCFKHDSIHNCTIVIACSPHTWNLFKRIRCALFCNLCTTKIYAQDVQVACFSSLVFFSCFAALLSFSECVGNGLTPCLAIFNGMCIERNNLVEMPLNEQNIFRIPVHICLDEHAHFTCRLFVPLLLVLLSLLPLFFQLIPLPRISLSWQRMWAARTSSTCDSFFC